MLHFNHWSTNANEGIRKFKQLLSLKFNLSYELVIAVYSNSKVHIATKQPTLFSLPQATKSSISGVCRFSISTILMLWVPTNHVAIYISTRTRDISGLAHVISSGLSKPRNLVFCIKCLRKVIIKYRSVHREIVCFNSPYNNGYIYIYNQHWLKQY